MPHKAQDMNNQNWEAEANYRKTFGQAFNRTTGEINRFTDTGTLWAIYKGIAGWGFGIWFAARRELIARGLLVE